jgi:hypothetical protein
VYRFTFLKLLFAQLIFKPEDQEREEFRLRFNECVKAWNELTEDANQNLWPVKKAKKVQGLMEGLFKHRWWRIR